MEELHATIKKIRTYKPKEVYEEATLEDVVNAPALKSNIRTIVTVDEPVKVKRIEVKPGPSVSRVPGSVWRVGSFKWSPVEFVTESERLNDKFVTSRMQENSLQRFIEDPEAPVIYGVGGNPDDGKAKLFAAFLVNLHVQHLKGKATVEWHTMFNGFDNPLMKIYDPMDGISDPTMLVLTNLGTSVTNLKLDKTRDLLERFSNIPRVVVVAGEDPMSYLTTRLNVPINSIAYFCESLVKRKVEVI